MAVAQRMVTMVTRGVDFEPGRLANFLVAGHSQKSTLKLRQKEQLCVLLMKEQRNKLRTNYMQQ
eukprot:604776-Pelagomonas_calceolata.AAC.1